MFELDEVQFSNWVNERKQPRKDTAKTINKNINQLKMERKHEVYN